MIRGLTIAGLALSALLPASQAMSTVSLADKEQAACYGDVQTLCGDAIPDVDLVTACMLTKRAKVSAGCLKYFPAEQPSG